MDKQVTYFGQTDSGIFCQALFGSAGAFEKTAGAPAFADWETGEEIRKYIGTITASDRKRYCYTLVNALGAGEYFGNNINADYFPWNALCHEGDDYGYKTFLAAHAFQHHQNKDPSRAFGVPVLSVLNHPMKRVELIIRLDREKAKVEGADGIVTRIDGGEFPDVSMGCRVPFDVCLECGHRSKTKEDYCVHMRPPPELRHIYGPNKILPSGIMIGVSNLTPRFFDISFVFIGADKTAKVMAKLAQVGGMNCLGDVCAVPRLSTEVYELTSGNVYVPEGLAKVASAPACACDNVCGGDPLAEMFLAKTASAPRKRKVAEIIKEIPTGVFSLRHLPRLEREEEDLPEELLEELADHPLSSSLGGMGAMGVVMKPHEYADVVLRRMGEDGLRTAMHDQLLCPRPMHRFEDSPIGNRNDVENVIGDILRALGPHAKALVNARSAFGRPFMVRVTIGSNDGKIPLPTRTGVAHPLLDKISAAYNGYRRELFAKLSQATEVVQSDPRLRETVLGDGLVQMFSKQADSVPIISLDSISYLMGAHLHDRSLLSNTAVAVSEELLREGLLAQGS